jgi:hypothetical protein
MTAEKDDTSPTPIREGIIIPIREEVIIAEVGGMVDETRLTLGIHGPDLLPEEISAVLGCAPTRAHRRGDPCGRYSPSWREGAWLLIVEGRAPSGPDELVPQLLRCLPSDRAIWEEVVARYIVRLSFGIFVGAWNRGFDLSPTSMKQLAALGVPVGFDIYADGECIES